MDEDDSMTKEDGRMKDWRPPHTAKGGGERFHINLSSGPESGVMMGGYD
jgi:hypothetical protein